MPLFHCAAFTNASYNDGTPALSRTFDRPGRIKTVTDATGIRTFTCLPGDRQCQQGGQ